MCIRDRGIVAVKKTSVRLREGSTSIKRMNGWNYNATFEGKKRHKLMFGWGVNPSRCKELVNSLFLRAGRISPRGKAPHTASGSRQCLKRMLNNMKQSSVPVWQFLCSYKNHVSFFFSISSALKSLLCSQPPLCPHQCQAWIYPG